MKLITYNYTNHIKHVIYAKEKSYTYLLYTYKIFEEEQRTELAKYEKGKIIEINSIDVILPFDINDPQKSIDNFRRLLIL